MIEELKKKIEEKAVTMGYSPDIDNWVRLEDVLLLLDELPHERVVNAILSKEDNENRVMTAREFIDMIVPEHGHTSCSDDNLDNGLFSRGFGDTWHGWCSRCLLLEILEDGKAPEGFEFYECTG